MRRDNIKSFKNAQGGKLPLNMSASPDQGHTMVTIINRSLLVGITLVMLYYVAVNAALFWNQCSSRVMIDEAWQMLCYTQHAEGGHSYYPASDTKRNYEPYTPFSSQIFGWTIRFLGHDIRWVRATAGLFGIGGIVLIGAMIWRLTGNRWLSVIVAGLATQLDILWYMNVGPNTIHVFFALLGTWLLIRMRDRAVTWSGALIVSLVFFLSYWSKQTGIVYLAGCLFYLILRSPAKGLTALLAMSALGVGSAWYYEHLPESRFLYMVFVYSQNHPIAWDRIGSMLMPLFFGRMGVLAGAALAAVLVWVAGADRWRTRLASPETIMLGASFVVGLYASCKYGSGPSQAWFFLCLLLVVGSVGLDTLMKLPGTGRLTALCLLLTQTLALYTNTASAYISAEDESRFTYIMNRLNMPGKTAYYVNCGYLNKILGKESWANCGHDCWWKKEFRRELYPEAWRKLIASDPWDIIIIDVPLEDGSFPLYERLGQGTYRKVEEIPPSSRFAASNRLRFRKIVFEKVVRLLDS